MQTSFSKEKIILIRKLIGLGSAVLCLLLMFFKFINYTSMSEVTNSSSIVWDEGISLFSFLFSSKVEVLAIPVFRLREIFAYSNVIMWISFVLVCISIVIASSGIFFKKNIISKVGSIVLVSALVLMFTISFDRYTIGNTVAYLDIFTLGFWLMTIISAVGLYSTITLKDSK